MWRFIVPLLVLVSFGAQAGLLFTFSELTTKDLEQMSKIVKTKIAESRRSDGDKVIPLKEALQAVLSRPNTDGMIEKVMGPLRSELDDHDSWEKSLRELTDESLMALRKNSAFKGRYQVTYLIFLENIITELLQPAVDNGFERALLEKIRDSDIDISKDAAKERTLRMMKQSPSPSEIAKKVLADAKPSKAKKSGKEVAPKDSKKEIKDPTPIDDEPPVGQ